MVGTICTCQDMDKWTDHQEHCALWGDLGFLRGTTAWHPIEKRLVTFLEWLEDNPGTWSEKLDEWPALVRVHEWGEERRLDLVNQGSDNDEAEHLIVNEVIDHLGIDLDSNQPKVPVQSEDLLLPMPLEDGEPEPELDEHSKLLDQLAQEALEDIKQLADMMPDQNTDEDGIVVQQQRTQYRCPHCKSLEMFCVECGHHCTLCDCIPSEHLLVCHGCQHMSSRPDPDDAPEPESTPEPEPMKSKSSKGGKANQNTKSKTLPSCSCIGECVKKDQHAFKTPMCHCTTECKKWCAVSKVERADEKDPWQWGAPYCSCKPEKTSYIYCFKCEVSRKSTSGAWEWDQHPSNSSYTGMGGFSYGGGTFVSKCRHYEFPLLLPSGVTVYASSLTQRKEEDPAPDFGIYCASSWDPACLAYLIAWPDYGTPKFKKAAVAAIKEGYDRAKSGQKVEVGCIGGHGRTGTALACMAVLAGVPGKDAVQWVQDNYCDHAVESPKQEWFVLWFEAFTLGKELPPEPVTVSKSHSSSTTSTKKWKGECPGCGHKVPHGNSPYCDGKGCKCMCVSAFENFEKELKKVGKSNTQFNHLEVVCPNCKHNKPKDRAFCDQGKTCQCVCNKALAEIWNMAELAKALPIFREAFNDPKAKADAKAPKKTKKNKGSSAASPTVQSPLPLSEGSDARPKASTPSPTLTPTTTRFSSTELGSAEGPSAMCLHPSCGAMMHWGAMQCRKCNTNYVALFWQNRLKEANEHIARESGGRTSGIEFERIIVDPEVEKGSTAGDFIWDGEGWIHKLSAAASLFLRMTRGKKGERND